MPLDFVGNLVVPALAVLAAVTMTFGNLAAYGQSNLKRLLAYSTISHAGFMIAGMATLNSIGAEAVLFYLATYVLMNLGAFAVVAFLRNATGSESAGFVAALQAGVTDEFVIAVIASSPEYYSKHDS